MNNAKMWLVVNPTVGVPLFLSAVAIGSFSVHVAVLSNTSWVSDFLSGRPLGSGSATAALMADPAKAPIENASYAIPGDGGEITIMMPDGTMARAILQPQDQLALN
jgi:light-harvesting protein B-800-850 alpha chain